jgi:hypothetical protein
MTLLDAIVHLAAELPDPSRLSTITFAGTTGMVVGALVAHLRDLPSDRAGDAMRSGLLLGFGTGLFGWIVSLAIDLL